MDTGLLYKPNFTGEDIKTVNAIFGYEFFKMPENPGADNNGKAALPENGKNDKTPEMEEKSITAEDNGAETNKTTTPESEPNGEQGNSEWDNFFNESKDIKP